MLQKFPAESSFWTAVSQSKMPLEHPTLRQKIDRNNLHSFAFIALLFNLY